MGGDRNGGWIAQEGGMYRRIQDPGATRGRVKGKPKPRGPPWEPVKGENITMMKIKENDTWIRQEEGGGEGGMTRLGGVGGVIYARTGE